VVPADYTARASALLLPPNSTQGTGGNPYLSLGGLQGAVDVLGRAMMSEQTVSEITNNSTEETYTLQADATTSGPLLVLDVKSRSPEGALALMESVLNRAPTVLKSLQTEVGAPAESLITLAVVAEDSTATTDRKSQTRALIVVLAAGLAFTILLTIVVDAALRRRSARKLGESTDALAPPASTSGPGANPAQGAAPPVRVRSGLRAPARSTSDRLR
jgi:hypothetical protein